MRRALAALALLLALAVPAAADVLLDGSSTPDGLPWAPLPELIDGTTVLEVPSSRGTVGGTSLLHSFERLGIDAQHELLLSDDLGVAAQLQRVIARVTGGDLSRIDGRLRSTIGTADVFLLNPAGIVFGPSGEIDVPGSFVASTAHELELGALRLATGSATPLPGGPLVPDPSAFGFLDAPLGEIRVEGAQLEVGRVLLDGGELLAEPADLWLIGGDIHVDGGFLSALQGDVALVAVASTGRISGVGGPASALALQGFSTLGDVRVTGEATVSSSAISPSLSIAGLDLLELTHDQLAGPLGELTFAPDDETVPVADVGGRTLYLRPAIPELGAGDVVVRARDLHVERADLRSVTPGRLDAGAIDVQLTGDLDLIGGGGSDSGLLARSGGVPIEGTIDLWRLGGAGSVRVAGELTAPGSGGEIRVQAGGAVRLSQGARISSSASTRGAGGDIELQARVLDISGDALEPADASGILSSTRSRVPERDAGEIRIRVDELRLDAQARILALTEAVGDGGSVRIDADRVEVLGGAAIDASSFSTDPAAALASGAGGAVEVHADGLVRIAGRGPDRPSRVGTTSQRSTGAAGSTLISAPRIEVFDGGEVRGLTRGSGSGGSVTLRGAEVVVRDGARLAAESTGSGDGGSVRVEAARTVEILDGAALAVDALELGGGISIEATELVHVRDSALVASVAGGVDSLGGDVDIDPRFVVLDGARILARATRGQGGEIRIRADHLFGLGRSVIDASSDFGVDGTVEILSPDADLNGAVIQLPDAFADASALLRDRCALRDQDAAGQFLVLGRDALPPSPDLPLAPAPGALSGTDAGRARTEVERALGLVEAGDRAGARAALTMALELASGSDDAWLWLRVARGLERVGGDGAHHAYARASALAEGGEDWLAASYAWGHLAQLYAEKDRLDEALVGIRRALLSAERARSAEARYRWQWRAGELLMRRGELERALASLRGAVRTLEALRLDAAGRGRDPRAFTRAFPTAAVATTLADALLRRAARTENPGERADLLREALAAAESGGVAELEDYFGDVCLTADHRRSISELPGVLLIRPVVLPDRTELIVSAGQRIESLRVDVTGSEVERVAAQLRFDLRDRTSPAYRTAAARLYDWLVRPLSGEIARVQPEVLVFALPARLRSIPMAALLDRDSREFLIEQHAVAVAPGLTLVEPRALALPRQSMLRAGLTRAVQGFPALAAVGEEIEALEGLFGGETLLDERFVLAGLERSLRASDHGMVHLASHAQFGGSIEEAFVLTYEDRLRADRLGALVRDTSSSGSPIELLTMSACHTASGDDRAVLGIAGVALQAGARSALASLWYVDDRAAARLVEGFYAGLEAGDSRAAALQRAQVTLLRDPAYQHPVDWSAFVLIGSWL